MTASGPSHQAIQNPFFQYKEKRTKIFFILGPSCLEQPPSNSQILCVYLLIQVLTEITRVQGVNGNHSVWLCVAARLLLPAALWAVSKVLILSVLSTCVFQLLWMPKLSVDGGGGFFPAC